MSTSAQTAPCAPALPDQIHVQIDVGILMGVSFASVAMDTDFKVIQYAQV